MRTNRVYRVWRGSAHAHVHGSGGGYDQGAYFARVIGGDYRWIAPSRFGFLGSPAPAGANTPRQTDAYACLLDALGIERVGVVGVSMGGPSSLMFARMVKILDRRACSVEYNRH